MITAKTTALILAMTIIGAATPAAFATSSSGGGSGIAVITGIGQSASNSDDDTNNQANVFAPEVKSEQTIKQNSGTQGSAFVINAATGGNTATQTSSQSVSASQSNTVNDDDEQENNQCASGPSVLNLASCLHIDASLLEALRAD